MTDTLFLRLRSPSADEPVECCVAGAGGIAAPERLPLAALAVRAAGRRVIAFIPTSDTLGVAVTLPPMSAAKVRAALPFALEDQLAGDLEGQHFAVGARLADGRWPVRVISRARLESWLAPLRGAGLEPQALFAEADGLREKPGDLMLWLDGDDAHWRAPGRAPVTLPTDALTEGPASAMDGDATGALGLRVHGHPDDIARHAAAIETLGGGFLQSVTQTLPEGPLPWLAAQSEAAQGVNLLQGGYAPTRSVLTGLEAWRWPLRLAVAALVLQILGWGLEAWRLHRAAVPVDAALLEAARPLDPSVQDPAAARELLRTRFADWDRRERDPSRAPLVAPLAMLADARASAPAVQLLSLVQAESGAVTARLGAADAPSLAAVRDALSAAGWSAAADPATAADTTAGAGAEITLTWSARP